MSRATRVRAILLLGPIFLVIVLGPFFAPYEIGETIGAPGAPPSAEALLGTDALGRDVLSRVLHGGLSVLLLGALATILAFASGMVVGLVAGYSRSWLDSWLMRGVDVLIAFPGLLVALLLIGGLGNHIPVLLAGVALINLPSIARLLRSATLELTTRGFVEASMTRGESGFSILRRDILPNLRTLILADVGVRFGYAVAAVASLNFLGFGLEPPAADWGLMISENRLTIPTNPLAVLAPATLLAWLVIAINLFADAQGSSRYFARRGRAALPSTSVRLSVGDGEPR